MEFNGIKMTDREMEKFGRFIEDLLGIKMPGQKKLLLQSRLNKRLKQLNMKNFDAYFSYLNTKEGRAAEYPIFVDLVSTHVTYFFREKIHFEQLYNEVLPELCIKKTGPKIRIWSAASSTGEEAYSIAITLNEFKDNNPGLIGDYEITGTDISSAVIEKAAKAVYSEESLQKVPLYFKQKYFMHSKDKSKNLVRVVPEVRVKVKFKILNLMNDFPDFEKKFDIIFIRNVLIYFNRETQKEITGKLIKHLVSGGFLFLGHSETLIGMEFNLKNFVPSIYRKG